MSGTKREGQLSAESSVRSVSTVASRSGMGARQLPSQRPTSNWGASRPSGMPGSSKRGYRPSTSTRRTTSSRAGDAVIDPFAPIKVIDDQGVNRTPKPLVAIVTSAALRQARYLGMQESVLGSETSEALLGEVSSTAFGRGWFDSASVTPQESSNDLDYSPGGRGLAPVAAAMLGEACSRMLRGTNSGSNKSGFSPSNSQRPTRTPPESGDGGREPGIAAAMRVLTDSDLAARHDVVLQDSGTIVMLEMPGIVVAADSPEGSQAAAANQRYTECLAEASSSDKCSTSYSQTPMVLLKHKEVQSGSSSNQTVACQATGYDIHDSFAELNKDQGDEAEDQLGSVLPSGAVVSSGHSGSGNQSSSLSASFIRSSTQQFRPSSMSSMRSSMAGWGGERSTFSRPASSRGSDRGGAAADSNAAAVALLAAEEVQEEPWTQLQGIAEVLEVMEAAVSQNIYLPQLMLYRDVKLPPPLVVSFDLGASGADSLPAVPSNPLTGAGSGQLNLASPGLPSRPSLCSTPGSSRPTGEQPWSAAHTPHGGSTIGHSAAHGSLAGMSSPSMSGARPSIMGGPGSMSGLGPASLLSRRPSYQVRHADLGSSPSRQSSIMSMGSSRVFRSNRPPASLQQLWTWSCSLTEGRPVSSMAWNSSNNNLLAAGYGARPSADAAPAAGAAGAAGVSAFAQGQQGSMVGQGALLSVPRPAAGEAAAGDSADGAAAADPDGAGGCVALWSLKNQFFPVWSFKTKAGVTSLDFSQRNPHMLGIGMHDGTVAVYDVRSRQATPVLASTAETGKHADPVWKVRWVDPGPEREEQLVSISTDGKVKAWTVAKGLEHNTLITLKRVPHKLVVSAGSNRSGSGGALAAGAAAAAAAAAMAATGTVPAGSGAKAAATVVALRGDGSGSRGAVINRNTGGMSFDFSNIDRRMYLAGTEDGHIHKCSTSYSEQYLETYHGHIGPVYALQWSPFNPSLFLSCSADWTIRMWQEGRQQALMTFQSSNKEVFDVAWCPSNSTVFAAVTADGRLELWDFAVSTLRPVCQHAVTKTAMTALLFAKDAPVVVSATDAGAVQVYRLVNIAADRFEPPELQHARLEEALRANIMKAALVGS